MLRCEIFPWRSRYPQNIGDYTLHALSVSSIAILLSLTGVTMLKCSEKQIRDHWSMLCFFYSYVSACFVVMEEPYQRTSFRFWTIVYSIVIATCMVGNAFGLTFQGVGAQVCLYAFSNVVIMSHVTHMKDNPHNISEVTLVTVLFCVTCIFILFIASDKVRRSMSSDTVTTLAFSILSMYWIILACLDNNHGPASIKLMKLESEWK